MFLLFLRHIAKLNAGSEFSRNTLMYKKVACILLILGVRPASALGQVTFSKDVAPILYRSCALCHHSGGSAPFGLLTYADARPRAAQIAQLAASRLMPPWKVDPDDHKFIGLDPLTAREISILQRWAADALCP